MTAMELSETTKNTHFEKNASGIRIKRAEYNWGGRLKEVDDPRMEGMVRMKDVRDSTYFTFRIISAKSAADKWLYHRDGTEGLDILGALANTVKPEVENMIGSGLKSDLNIFN